MLEARETLPGRDAKSEAIQHRVLELPEYRHSKTVATYMAVKSEVAVRSILERAWRAGKRVAAPVVTPDGLELFFIRSLEELAPAAFGLLEPGEGIRRDAGRICPVGEVSLFLVPGLAFDERGGRLGYGKAYYDRLLTQAATEAIFAGLAYECQMTPQVPMTPRDIFMHLVVTESATYRPPSAPW